MHLELFSEDREVVRFLICCLMRFYGAVDVALRRVGSFSEKEINLSSCGMLTGVIGGKYSSGRGNSLASE